MSNALAKLFDKSSYNFGFYSFTLVDEGAAHNISASGSDIRPLAAFYQNVISPHWGFWVAFLTFVELAVGLGLVLGITSRLAAVGGLLLVGPVWIMLWNSGSYLWEYPAEDLLPLVLLAIAPAGRRCGFDGRLAARFGHRWPF